MDWSVSLELMSYVVTIVGLPLAIVIFTYEQHRARSNEEEAIYQSLSDAYSNFLTLVLENSDLKLLTSESGAPPLTEDQLERRAALFEILVSLFERAYILIHSMRAAERQRLWQSWADYMSQWCQRRDFREALPPLLEGEDEAFRRYISRLMQTTDVAGEGVTPATLTAAEIQSEP